MVEAAKPASIRMEFEDNRRRRLASTTRILQGSRRRLRALDSLKRHHHLRAGDGDEGGAARGEDIYRQLGERGIQRTVR